MKEEDAKDVKVIENVKIDSNESDSDSDEEKEEEVQEKAEATDEKKKKKSKVKETALDDVESATEEGSDLGEWSDDEEKREAEAKLLKKESSAKNKALKTLFKLFKKKLDFEGSENILNYQGADRAKLKKWEDKLEVHGIYMAKECCL